MAFGHTRRIEQRLRRDGAHRLSGAEHVARHARLDNAGAERRSHLVATPRYDHRSAPQARELGELGRDLADDLVARDDTRQPRGIDAKCGEQLVGPRKSVRVERHRRRRARSVDHVCAGGEAHQECPRKQIPGGLCPRPVPHLPRDLSRDVRTIEVAT